LEVPQRGRALVEKAERERQEIAEIDEALLPEKAVVPVRRDRQLEIALPTVPLRGIFPGGPDRALREFQESLRRDGIVLELVEEPRQLADVLGRVSGA
jgi:hypothetical protein